MDWSLSHLLCAYHKLLFQISWFEGSNIRQHFGPASDFRLKWKIMDLRKHMVVAAGPRRAIDLHPNFSSLMCCLVTFFFFSSSGSFYWSSSLCSVNRLFICYGMNSTFVSGCVCFWTMLRSGLCFNDPRNEVFKLQKNEWRYNSLQL